MVQIMAASRSKKAFGVAAQAVTPLFHDLLLLGHLDEEGSGPSTTFGVGKVGLVAVRIGKDGTGRGGKPLETANMGSRRAECADPTG